MKFPPVAGAPFERSGLQIVQEGSPRECRFIWGRPSNRMEMLHHLDEVTTSIFRRNLTPVIRAQRTRKAIEGGVVRVG